MDYLGQRYRFFCPSGRSESSEDLVKIVKMIGWAGIATIALGFSGMPGSGQNDARKCREHRRLERLCSLSDFRVSVCCLSAIRRKGVGGPKLLGVHRSSRQIVFDA